MRLLLAVPGLPALFTWALLGRLHQAGTPVALGFLIAGWTGSYAIAGLVAGSLTLGLGIAGPLRGRAADRSPASRLLLITALSYGLGLGVLGLLPSFLPGGAWPLAVLVAFLTGLAMPPVTQISRAAWPRMTEEQTRHAVFTLEASMQELLYVTGPSIAAFTVALASPRAATWLCGGLAVGGVRLDVDRADRGRCGGAAAHRFAARSHRAGRGGRGGRSDRGTRRDPVHSCA